MMNNWKLCFWVSCTNPFQYSSMLVCLVSYPTFYPTSCLTFHKDGTHNFPRDVLECPLDSKCEIFSSALLIRLSGKSVEICMGAVLGAVTMSGLIPLLRCVRYASVRVGVKFPMEINTNLLRCSMVFAAACVMLELKSIKYCNSSMALDTLVEVFPLLSLVRRFFSWLCMSCCTLKRHLLNLAA